MAPRFTRQDKIMSNITILRSNQRTGKVYKPNNVKETSAQIYEANIAAGEIQNIQHLKRLLVQENSAINSALILARPKNPDAKRLTTHIVKQQNKNNNELIERNKASFTYNNQNSFMMFDIDDIDNLKQCNNIKSRDDLYVFLKETFPELFGNTELLIGYSSSASIIYYKNDEKKDFTENKIKRKYHVYINTTNQPHDEKTIQNYIETMCIKKDLFYFELNKAKSIQKKYLFDLSVYQTNRIIFESKNELIKDEKEDVNPYDIMEQNKSIEKYKIYGTEEYTNQKIDLTVMTDLTERIIDYQAQRQTKAREDYKNKPHIKQEIEAYRNSIIDSEYEKQISKNGSNNSNAVRLNEKELKQTIRAKILKAEKYADIDVKRVLYSSPHQEFIKYNSYTLREIHGVLKKKFKMQSVSKEEVTFTFFSLTHTEEHADQAYFNEFVTEKYNYKQYKNVLFTLKGGNRTQFFEVNDSIKQDEQKTEYYNKQDQINHNHANKLSIENMVEVNKDNYTQIINKDFLSEFIKTENTANKVSNLTFVNEEIYNTIFNKQDKQLCLFTAPTGTGKTTAFKKYFDKYILTKTNEQCDFSTHDRRPFSTYIFVAPTINLCKEICTKLDIASTTGGPSETRITKEINSTTYKNIKHNINEILRDDDVAIINGKIIKKIIVITHESFLKNEYEIINALPLNEKINIVFDEAHELIKETDLETTSTERRKINFIENIALNTNYNLIQNKNLKYILVTATPQTIKTLLLLKNRNEYEIYNACEEEMYINTKRNNLITYNPLTLIKRQERMGKMGLFKYNLHVMDIIMRAYGFKKKILCLINNKEEVIKTQQEAKKAGYNCYINTSSTKEFTVENDKIVINTETAIQETELQKRGTIFLCTSTLTSGVNIKMEDLILIHFYKNTDNSQSPTQFLSRNRITGTPCYFVANFDIDNNFLEVQKNRADILGWKKAEHTYSSWIAKQDKKIYKSLSYYKIAELFTNKFRVNPTIFKITDTTNMDFEILGLNLEQDDNTEIDENPEIINEMKEIGKNKEKRSSFFRKNYNYIAQNPKKFESIVGKITKVELLILKHMIGDKFVGTSSSNLIRKVNKIRKYVGRITMSKIINKYRIHQDLDDTMKMDLLEKIYEYYLENIDTQLIILNSLKEFEKKEDKRLMGNGPNDNTKYLKFVNIIKTNLLTDTQKESMELKELINVFKNNKELETLYSKLYSTKDALIIFFDMLNIQYTLEHNKHKKKFTFKKIKFDRIDLNIDNVIKNVNIKSEALEKKFEEFVDTKIEEMINIIEHKKREPIIK